MRDDAPFQQSPVPGQDDAPLARAARTISSSVRSLRQARVEPEHPQEPRQLSEVNVQQ